MPAMQETQEIVRRYLNARVPLIVIRSIEPARVADMLTGLAKEMRNMPFYSHSRTEGLKQLPSNQSVLDDYSLQGALEQARSTFKTTNNTNFIFSDVEDLDQETSTSRHMAEMARLAETRQGAIILIVSKPVWTGLSRLGMTASLDLPTTGELTHVLNAMIEDHRGVVNISWEKDHVRSASEILSGITEMEAVNVLATMLAKGSLAPDDLAELSQFKDRIFSDLNGIERVKLQEGYQVGGMRNLREWLKTREELMKADLSATSLKPPKGVLLVGVPGCGKSLSAKAIATEWKLPLYRLDMSSILGMYVGQSESQLREALETAERVAPCVLWIDEIEKALASGNGDSGTSRRLIGQFLFWLQESTAKVFMVATANEVSSLPPELLRKGRFDEMFFVDLPDAQDREEILRLYFTRYLKRDLEPELAKSLVDLTEGFSGSDIDAAVHDIASAMFTSHTPEMPADSVISEFFANVVPYSQTNSEDVAAIRSWGQGRAVPAGANPVTSKAPDGAFGRRVVVM